MGDLRKVNPLSTMMGLLRIQIIRGINLAIRDVNSSDPYIVVRHGKQKLKTRVIKKNINPIWDEDLTLYIMDPNEPLKLLVYDYDTFSTDDEMGDAEIDIKPFLEAAEINLNGSSSGAVIKKADPSQRNCIVWSKGKLTQDLLLRLRLRNVECGEIELSLTWIDIPTSLVA